MDTGSLVAFLIVTLVLIGIFLLLRRFWWWYWGIDRIVMALESIDESLLQLPGVREHSNRHGRATHSRAWRKTA